MNVRVSRCVTVAVAVAVAILAASASSVVLATPGEGAAVASAVAAASSVVLAIPGPDADLASAAVGGSGQFPAFDTAGGSGQAPTLLAFARGAGQPAVPRGAAGADAGPGSRVDALAALLRLQDIRGFDAPAFATLAGNPDDGVRTLLARVLAGTADGRVAPLLGHLARDRSPAVRAAAAEAIGRLLARPPGIGDDKAVRKLEKALAQMMADSDAAVVAAAAWGIGSAGGATSGKVLIKALGREQRLEVRAAILAELWRTQGTAWVPAAATALGDADAGVRFAAAWSLARRAKPECAGELQRAALDSDPLVRVAALSAARRGRAGDLAAAALAGTGHGDVRVRIAAFDALQAAFDAPGAPTLPETVIRQIETTIADADIRNRHERVAAIRLAAVAGCAVSKRLTLVATGQGWVRAEAIRSLGRHPSTLGALGDDLRRASDPEVRAAAIAGSARLPGAAGILTRALTDDSVAVRLAAIEAGTDVAGAEFDAALLARLDDGDVAVRSAAIEALAARKALPEPAVLLARLRFEATAKEPDAAVALIEALRTGALTPQVRDAVRPLLSSPNPVLARAAWVLLRAKGVMAPQPVIAGESAEFYRQVIDWAATPRFLDIITQRGTISLSLDTAGAPLTCYRLSRLAEAKAYDGLTFHRVVPDFVVQGGDPRGDGWGGPGFTLRDELSVRSYQAGTVGLAHGGPDTAGCQFFVTLTPQPHLTGRYPVLGEVVRGLDVAERIGVGDRILRVKASDSPQPWFPIWYGTLDEARLDREITGWREERERTEPDRAMTDLLATARGKYEITVAMGTWCGDSREQVPRLEKILASLGERSPFTALHLIGIDRSKDTAGSTWRFGAVELVPTIVVTAGGAEIGRIVETPSSGSLERDLARILAVVEGWDLPAEQTPHG